nr:hypothetical protein [uncultured bacterium]
MAGISLLSSFITMASLATSGPPGRNDAAAIGAALGLTMGFGIAIAMAAGSLLYGTIGLIFWMRREVWKCDKCGSFIDRSKP